MSGTIIRVAELASYEFSNIAVDYGQYVLLAQHIDTSQWREASLLVRVVQFTMADSSHLDDILLTAAIDAWDASSGTTIYTPEGANAFPLAASSLNPAGSGSAPPSEPFAMLFALSNFGSMVQVLLQAVRGTGVATGTELTISLSVDLVLKD